MAIIKVRCTHTFEFNTEEEEDVKKYVKLKGVRDFQELVRHRFETNMEYAYNDVMEIDVPENMPEEDDE